jgi:hypothetical protein
VYRGEQFDEFRISGIMPANSLMAEVQIATTAL